MNTRLSPPSIRSLADLRQLQRVMGAALFRPLTAKDSMQTSWEDGRSSIPSFDEVHDEALKARRYLHEHTPVTA